MGPVYRGRKGIYPGARVTKDGTLFSHDASCRLVNHSPTGFQWGYCGSGPSQLALALLLDVTGDPEVAQELYQQFKREFVAQWGDSWAITHVEILAWVRQHSPERYIKEGISNASAIL